MASRSRNRELRTPAIELNTSNQMADRKGALLFVGDIVKLDNYINSFVIAKYHVASSQVVHCLYPAKGDRLGHAKTLRLCMAEGVKVVENPPKKKGVARKKIVGKKAPVRKKVPTSTTSAFMDSGW